MDKIKVLVIPSDTQGGVGKFRSFDPHTYLQEHYGDEFDVDIITLRDFPQENIDKWLANYNLVVFHKQLDRKGQLLNLCHFLGIPTICDIDDSPILTPDHPMYISWKKQNWFGTMRMHLEGVDYVTTTTPIFAKELKKYNKNVAVLPNAIDPNDSQFSTKKAPSKRIRFGLVCGSTHMKDIELIQGINALPQDIKDKIQIVLCGADYRGKTTIYKENGEAEVRDIRPAESIWVKYEEYLTKNYEDLSPEHIDFLKKYIPNVDDPFDNEFYRKFCTRDIKHYGTHYENVDVLLAPLKINEFNKVKSQLKFIECGFTNTAIVASDYGPYTIDSRPYRLYGGEINPDKPNCWLIDEGKNHKDWVKAIKYLVEHPEAVEAMRTNLRNDMLEKYSLDAVTKQRVELYKGVIEEHREKLAGTQS